MDATRLTRIAALRALPSQVRVATEGLTDLQLDTPYRDGGWTVRQVVHHIADSHMNALLRMKLVMAEDHPTLKPYDENVWALLSTSKLPVAASIAMIDGMQEHMATLAEHASDADWRRSANHPENGEMTFDDLVRIYADHGKHHVGQITGLRTRMGW